MPSQGDNWSTPPALFARYDRLYGFGLDAAAGESNTKCARWFGPGGEHEDALSIEWPTDVNIWCNPPYSRGLQWAFAMKANECARNGGVVVMLLPADTSTRLYHQLVKVHPHEFLCGRVRFQGAPGPAKFGSVVVVFK